MARASGYGRAVETQAENTTSAAPNTVVVGGTGLVGAWIADELAARGHTVTIAGRTPPAADSPAARHAFVAGDYTAPGWTERLRGFDQLVFAAGQDIRHVGPHADDATWEQVQSHALPRFFAEAREAGVQRAVMVGSYYHQVTPHLVATNRYVAARAEAEAGVLALASDTFRVCAVNPPNIVGEIGGRSLRTFAKQVAWARGALASKIGDTAPPGGTNYLSVRAVAEACAGALERGEPGTAYLIGDENLSYRDWFQAVFDAAGSDRLVVEVDEPHPLLPDDYLVAGRGYVIAYEPDPDEAALLGYRRGDLCATLAEMVAAADALPPRT